MSKIIWDQTDIYHNAKINDKQVGCCWKGLEDTEVFYYVSHKGTGQTETLAEAKGKIEELNDK